MLLALILACSQDRPKDELTPEPLVLPDDPSEPGAPVGVRTIADGEQTFEIWYPAPDAAFYEEQDEIDFTEFVPDPVLETLPGLTLPTLGTGAVRGADLRRPEAPYPVILFSHGFGGMRVQSLEFAAHLASRGYVVVGVDHPGRMMGDVLPCLFSPPLEGCDLSGFAADPGPEDLEDALAWVTEANTTGTFADALDLTKIALSGHSAGAGSTATLGEEDDRFSALLLMAGGAEISRDVPTLFFGGSCDGFADTTSMDAAASASTQASSAQIAGAGHLAFSDLCDLNLGDLGDTWLAGRDDLNQTIVDGLFSLATDGCPGGVPTVSACGDEFLELEASAPIVRHVSTAFFDGALKGEETALNPGTWPELEVR